MRGYKQKPNWILVALLIIAYQLITYQYIIPISKGLPIGGLTSEMMAADLMIVPIATVLSIILAYITSIVFQGMFYSKGFNAGRAVG